MYVRACKNLTNHDVCGARIMELFLAGSVSRQAPTKALLGDVNRLYELARDKKPASRTRLAEEVSKLLIANVSPRESELVADVLIELLAQAQVDLRRALSQRLSSLEKVPLRLVLQLANDQIDVASPMLINSRALGEFDLMYIIKSKGPEYWAAIAQRRQLSEQVVDLLAETKDIDTAIALAENKGIKLTNNALTILADMAQGVEKLALPLLRREEVSADLAKALYQYVGAEIKGYIDHSFGSQAPPEEVSEAVDQVIVEFTEQPLEEVKAQDQADVIEQKDDYEQDRTETHAPANQDVLHESISAMPSDLRPDAHMFEVAKDQKAKGLLSIPMMMETLRQNRLKSFVAQFAAYTEISPVIVGQILSQTNGKSLSVVARAFNIEKQDFVSIFMMTGKIWNNGELVQMNEVKGALEYYNKTTSDLARRIVKEKMQA